MKDRCASKAASRSAMAGVEQWVSDQLHSILGMSDRYVAQFLINMAQKSSSQRELVEKIRDTGTISVNDEVVGFVGQLWEKVPHREPREKPARAHERAVRQVLEQNAQYALLPDSDEEAPSTAPRKKSSTKRHLRRKTEDASDEDTPVVAAASSRSVTEADPEEDERLRDLKERDEFAARLRDRDKDKTRNIVERSDKKAFEEAAKRLKLEAEDRLRVLPRLRVESRRRYLEKRKEDKLVELEADIQDEHFLFSDVPLTERERKELEYKQKVLQLAKEHDKARQMEKVQRYRMPQERKGKEDDIDELVEEPQAEQRKWEEDRMGIARLRFGAKDARDKVLGERGHSATAGDFSQISDERGILAHEQRAARQRQHLESIVVRMVTVGLIWWPTTVLLSALKPARDFH